MAARARLAAPLLAAALLLAACVSPVNRENYEKVQKGMSYTEVTALLGEPTESSGGGIGGLSATSATWKAKDGTVITVTFVNDKVTIKTFGKGGGTS